MDEVKPDQYLDFVRKYRVIRNLPLGGTRASWKYRDITSRLVMSVSPQDDPGQAPFRTTLSNFKLCYPITSYGVIVKCRELGKDWYLLIKRTNSVEYTDLIRGAYRESQLFFLLKKIPDQERQRLIQYTDRFDDLWLDLMGSIVQNEVYLRAKHMFQKIAPGLQRIFNLVPSVDPDGKNLWLFPKGRIEYQEVGLISTPESPWECAIRELTEETNGLPNKWPSYKIVRSDPIEEVWFGTNNKNYSSNYFVIEVNNSMLPDQFPRRQTPIREVSDGEVEVIQWISSDELDRYLPDRRIELIRQINSEDLSETQLNIKWTQSFELTEV